MDFGAHNLAKFQFFKGEIRFVLLIPSSDILLLKLFLGLNLAITCETVFTLA